jgi:IS5 family transposase
LEQWKILVLGVLRLGLNADYDRIHELANQHKTLRQMLGHSDFDPHLYHLQTLLPRKDNLRIFTPEILDRINVEVVRSGHQLLKKTEEENLAARCDSFVLETDVHFPTDINLLYDAIRKMIEECAHLSQTNGLDGWRQSAYNIRQFKKKYRLLSKLKHSTSQDENKQKAKENEIREEHRNYLNQAEDYMNSAKQTRKALIEGYQINDSVIGNLNNYIEHAERQCDQIQRRVLQDEQIPHEEKVLSIFEPHTEWINKGKAGIPVELGVKVCILEDTTRFILHHEVMERETDEKIAVKMVVEGQARFPNLSIVSMDKGFHSPENQLELKQHLDKVILPKKGRLSQVDQERENEAEFIKRRHHNEAVESAINALEVHGLDKCPDHGIDGLKRYVSLAVLARNIQRLGVGGGVFFIIKKFSK